MSATSVQRDERTAAVENASYRWGYLVLSFGVLILVMYRRFALGESNWDLLALVIGGGVVTSVYQGANRVLTGGWVRASVVTVVAAAIVAAIVTFARL
jgi:hypothetical protein